MKQRLTIAGYRSSRCVVIVGDTLRVELSPGSAYGRYYPTLAIHDPEDGT